MPAKQIHAVTGAFGYSGKYITGKLLERGHVVITLTNSPNKPNPFGEQLQAFPFHFDQPRLLAQTLKDVRVLYNTYWVRFNHPLFTHANAVQNTRILFEAAKQAGVERIIHISITNPSEDSPLEYFSSKARLERALIDSGISYAILRPAVLFGKEDILINNIAWTLRHLPIFGIFGDGNYRLQPIYVADLADLAVEQGERNDNVVINTIGQETYTYRELVRTIGMAIGKQRPIISVPPWVGYAAGKVIGWLVNDVVLTRQEVEGLMAGLLYVDAPPAGKTRFSDWAKAHAGELGLHYASELGRRRGVK